MPDVSLVQDSETVYDTSPIPFRRAIVLFQTAASQISSPVQLLPEKEAWWEKVAEAIALWVGGKNISGNNFDSEL
jgi:hypothetical protein